MTSKKSSSNKSDMARSEVRISVADQVRELTIETTADRDEVLSLIKKALESSQQLVLTDTRGRNYVVPATKIGSVEIGDISERRVGFAGA
jgi:Cft2 family RNA processing exonuclease